jgi:hypothetical protein
MVKRIVDCPVVNPHDVRKHYGLLFWQQCWFCEMEFRREAGYKWLFGGRTWCYSCSDCSASISHCNDNLSWRNATAVAKMKALPPPMRTFSNARRQPLWTD